MPEFSTYIDIDPSEYVDECSKSEIKELIDELVIHGYINQSDSLIDKEIWSRNRMTRWDQIKLKVLTKLF